ncbi:MAG: TolC family protein [Cellvibrio sp.]|uniref:TolC family protein n=1 Tax=Cellvibrio sp. TaxID=1965322 RepID=UPI0031A93AF5
MNTTNLLTRSSFLLCATLLLSACATTPPDTAKALIEQQLSARYPTAKLSATAPVLANKTLGLDDAVQTLLGKSPQVRIELAQLGIANAQQLQAELISNPHISLGALRPEDGGRWQLDAGLSLPLLELFTRPLRREMAQENLLSTQLHLQDKLQKLIAKTSTAYYSAIAAQQHLQVARTMFDATRARQQLADSMYRAGNLSENNFLFYDNELRRVQQQVKQRELKAQKSYLKLLNVIGLDSTQVVILPTQLPLLPSDDFSHATLFAQAQSDRLDLQIVQQQSRLLEQRSNLLRKENGWRDMTIGVNAEREFDGAKNIGPEIELALPLFNRNQGKLATVTAQLEKNKAQLDQLRLNTDSEIAQALNQMQSSRSQLELITSSLQVAGKRVLLSNREVNFMLSSPLELLDIKRQEIQLAHDYTNELAAYWQARTQLELAIGRALPTSESIKHNGMDHSKMDHGDTHHDHMNHKEMDHSNMNHADHTNAASEHEEHHHD